MKLSRQVGSTSQILQIFVQDATASTGAGLANIIGSTVNYSWMKNNQAAFSTGTASTAGATTGTFTTSGWTQVHSSQMKGFYHFCPPDGMFDGGIDGGSGVLLIYGSTGVAASMAPLAVEVELTKTNNQIYMSSTRFTSTQIVSTVINLSSVSASLATILAGVNITSIQGSNAVTTSAGTLGVSLSGTSNVNVIQIQGSAAVTSSAGLLDVNISRIANTTSAGQPGYMGLDWGKIVNPNSSQVLSSTFISTSQVIAGATAPTAAQVAAAVWDEITTSHTASSSFGRTATAESANVSSLISGVNTTTQTAPVTLSAVSSSAWPYFGIIDSGAAVSTGANSITLRAALNISTNTLNGATIYIASATTNGTGARRLVTSWSGANDIAGVDAWDAIPDSTATYYVFATPPAGLAPASVNLTQIQGSNAVTTSAGILGVANSGLVGVSTITTLIGVSTITTPVGVSTFAGTTNANVIQVMGSAAVTSSAGLLNINVSRILNTTSAGQPGYVGIDWANIANPNTSQNLSSTFISTTQVIAGASAPTAAQVAAAVWDEVTTSHTASSTFGQGMRNQSIGVSTLTSGVNMTSISGTASVGQAGFVGIDWGKIANPNSSQVLSSTFISTSQVIAGASAPTALQVAQAVWDEVATSHTASSSFGRTVSVMAAAISTQAVSSDSRLINLDGSVSSRVASSDSRIATLTAAERATLAGVILTTTMAEGYRSANAIGSLSQLNYEILANLIEFGNSGTTRTLNSVTSHGAISATYQYNSTTPSAITRIA